MYWFDYELPKDKGLVFLPNTLIRHHTERIHARSCLVKVVKRNREHTEEEIRHRRVTPEAQGASSRVQATFLSTRRLVPIQ